jgi:hypothetical protein
MRSTRILLIGTVLIQLGFGAAVTRAGQEASTFSGSYAWSQGGSDRLSVEFKPDGESRWEVTFRFRFNGRSQTWKGTAQGSLTDGSTLSGTATSGSRNWVFEAGIEDGVMHGTHREIKRGRSRYPTGTFELSR